MPWTRKQRAAAAIRHSQSKAPERKDQLERAADAYLKRAGYDKKGRPLGRR